MLQNLATEGTTVPSAPTEAKAEQWHPLDSGVQYCSDIFLPLPCSCYASSLIPASLAQPSQLSLVISGDR